MKKKLLLWVLPYFVVVIAWSQGVKVPRTASPAATVSQTIGISSVTVNYSRPAVKNRAIWGELVPYGWTVQGVGNGNEAPWRAGANENTVITFTHDALVEGKPVPAGSYGLFFVVNKDNTGELVLSKDTRSWGSFFYDKTKDQLRAPISLKDIPHTELLTYEFTGLTKNSGELVLNWEKKQFPVKIAFAVDDIVLENAEAELKGVLGFNWQGPLSAANYALNNKIQLDKALEWADKAVAQNNSFTTIGVKANILKEMGETEKADLLIKDAIPNATENELNNYGYQLLGLGKYDEAIAVFALATQRFPKSANAWDSLGEAYYTKGDKKNAISNFKKSMSMNPPSNVKANSEKFLKLLGAM